MSETGEAPEAGRTDVPRQSWGQAAWRAAVILVLAYLGFVIVSDRLVNYLSLHVVTVARDILVLLWVVAYFVFLCWLFVKLQPGEAS